jgi:hypothetical protein
MSTQESFLTIYLCLHIDRLKRNLIIFKYYSFRYFLIQSQCVSNLPGRRFCPREVRNCMALIGLFNKGLRQQKEKLAIRTETGRKSMCRCKMVATGMLEVVIAVIMMTSILGCAELRTRNSMAGTYDGPSRDMGGGSAHAFITLDADGKPTAIGIRMSETALLGLPAEPPPDADGWEYVLSLPKEAAISGYKHVVIDWNPKGHIPIGVYNTPHFDFHFYLISPEQREKITAKGEDLARAHKAPAPELMPEGYILPEGTEVPRMGAHAIDTTAPEFNKLAFAKTFIYGFYDGEMIFVEPMMTKAFLETKPNTTDPVKLPETYSIHAYYPKMYSVTYNATHGEYEVSLENLIYR